MLRNFLFILLLFAVLNPTACQLPCSILIKALVLYVKPTYKYGLLLDKGHYTHHFTYAGTGLSESMTEIPFSNNVAYLARQWDSSAFAFPSLFYMTIDVRTGYGSETDGDSSQVIFRKLKNDNTLFVEARIQFASRSEPADLVVMTPSETKIITGFFPVNTNGSYVEVGFMSLSGAQIIVLRNGIPYFSDAVATAGSDDENHEFILGGATATSCSPACFQGGLKRITVYAAAMGIAPPAIPIDSYCAETYNAWAAYFDADGWPYESFFGPGWNHVRRIAPSAPSPSWIVLKDKDGKFIMNDNLHGYGTGQSDAETFLFKDKSSVKGTVTASRPYFLWDYDEYLVATGDMSLWAWFTKKELDYAIGNSTLFTGDVRYEIMGYTSNYPTKLRGINAWFQSSQRLTLTMHNDMRGLNKSGTAFYGEISTPADPSNAAISILSREGINVFVRNSNSSKLPFKCGDGYRTLPEECDDGNTRDGDGCSSTCTVEEDYYCKRGSYNNLYLSDYPCCHISCDDCTIPGTDTCVSCRTGFVIDGISCVETCGDGKKMGQLDCDDGNTVDGDGCDHNCNVEPGYNCTGGNVTAPDTCRNVLNFTFSIEYVDSFEQILLTFNKEVAQLKTSNGGLAIIGANILGGIRVVMSSDSESEREITIAEGVTLSTKNLKLTLSNVGGVCGSKNIAVTINGTNFTDLWGNELKHTTVGASFLKRCYAKTMSAQADTMLIVFGSMLGFALVVAFLSGKGLALAWELFGTTQILSLFCIINLKLMPVCLTDFMEVFSTTLLSIIPNVIALVAPSAVSHLNDADNKLTDNLGFHPNLFNKDMLLNVGYLVTLYGIVALGYPALLFLSFKYPAFTHYVEKFRWNVILRTVMLTFFQLFLACIVQFKYITFSAYTFFTVSSTVSVVVMVLLVDFVVLVALLAYYRSKNLLGDECCKRCGTLFNEYTTKRNLAAWTSVVFMVRRALSIIVLVTSPSQPLVQIAGLFFINAAAMAWEIIVRPEKSWIGLVNSMGSESIILLINALMVRVSMPSTGEEELENLGLAVVALMITCFIWNYGCWVVSMGIDIYSKLKRAATPPAEPTSKKVDEYFPPFPKEEKESAEKYRADKSLPSMVQLQSTTQVLENSAIEKEVPEGMVSVVEEIGKDEIKQLEVRSAREVSSKDEEARWKSAGSQVGENKKAGMLIHPVKFFRDAPPAQHIRSSEGSPKGVDLIKDLEEAEEQ